MQWTARDHHGEIRPGAPLVPRASIWRWALIACVSGTLSAGVSRAQEYVDEPAQLPDSVQSSVQEVPSPDSSTSGEPLPSYEPDRMNLIGKPGWMKTYYKLKAKVKGQPPPITSAEELAEAPKVVRDADGRWRPAIAQKRSQRVDQDFAPAEELFRKGDYHAAQKEFRKLKKKYKDKPPEEEAIFMLAESYFLQDRLPYAEHYYNELLTKYPTTRFLPQSVQRLYDIAYYWLEDSQLLAQGKETKHSSFTNAFNLFDKTRPLFDTPGRAIDAIDMLQQYDPFGPLTDDAMMMAGAHEFTNGSFIQAAGHYEQIVADQPKSEHAPKALVLASQAYLRTYEGPAYDGEDLLNAERLTKAALNRRAELQPEQVTRLEKDLASIPYERARRDFFTAHTYERLRRPESAQFLYSRIIRDYPDTEFATKSTEAIERIDIQLEKKRNSWTAKVMRMFRKDAEMVGRATGGDRLDRAPAEIPGTEYNGSEGMAPYDNDLLVP